MMDPGLKAFGIWSGGRFLHFGRQISEERLITLIQQAYESGVRTFLTADVYGPEEADHVLGRALKHYPRETYCLVGMVGHDFYKGRREGAKGFPRFTDPALRGPEEYADYLRMAADRSLERLGTDRFDLLMLHNPDQTGYESPIVWDALEALRSEGKTRLLGLAPGPANGFTLDIINCVEKFGERIDWAMIILNPFEPWPGKLCLPALEKHGVKALIRVVDYGGIFHDDMRPGHHFGPGDHRAFRPAGWVEAAAEKLERIRPIGRRHQLTMLQLACQWCMGHMPVASVAPTLLQEAGETAKRIEDQLTELANLPEEQRVTPEEILEITRIGDNTGCMALKGASRQYQGVPQGDQWPMTEQLEQVAERWNIHPDRDLYYEGDPRDLREKGTLQQGMAQATDRRLYFQLQVFTGSNGTGPLIEALKSSGLESVLYANVNDPRGVGVLLMSEDPADFATRGRDLFDSEPFSKLVHVPEMTMFGRSYGTGREPDIEDWLLAHPRRNARNANWPWAIWYPLRRKGEFYRLEKREQGKILMEHGVIGRQWGQAGYAGDIRLECFGMDRDDNEFVIGLTGPRLDWLSKLIGAMRPTTQTSMYMDKLGPFFIGRALYQSPLE